MSKNYTTVQGDKWDSIAYRQLGSVSHTDLLMRQNLAYHDLYIFPAGIVLELPEINATTDGTADTLPPWKQVAG
jgi:phage tail protein X